MQRSRTAESPLQRGSCGDHVASRPRLLICKAFQSLVLDCWTTLGLVPYLEARRTVLPAIGYRNLERELAAEIEFMHLG